MKANQSELGSSRRRTLRQSLQACGFALFAVMVWGGCTHEARVTTDINPVGTYTLVSVDGNKVPCDVQHEGHRLAIKSGTFILNADGTCTSKMTFTPPTGPEANREVRATYTRQGSKLTMKWEGAGMTIGTIAGDTFTMNNEGMVLAYRK